MRPLLVGFHYAIDSDFVNVITVSRRRLYYVWPAGSLSGEKEFRRSDGPVVGLVVHLLDSWLRLQRPLVVVVVVSRGKQFSR